LLQVIVDPRFGEIISVRRLPRADLMAPPPEGRTSREFGRPPAPEQDDEEAAPAPPRAGPKVQPRPPAERSAGVAPPPPSGRKQKVPAQPDLATPGISAGKRDPKAEAFPPVTPLD
jgi:hypothetical protein